MPGATPPSLEVVNDNYKGALKELYDHYSHCGNVLEYRSQRRQGATAQHSIQWDCTLTCPSIERPFTLDERIVSGEGRSKPEAEQACARRALAEIRRAAPHLGLREPCGSPGGSAVPLSTLSDDGGSASTAAAPGSPPLAGDEPAAPSPERTPSPHSASANDAGIDAMDAAQLRQELRAARAREAALAARAARLEACAHAERRCLQEVKHAIDEALQELDLDSSG